MTINDRICFPLQLIKRERPDFLLKAGSLNIGIEITEAINEEYAKAVTLPEAASDDAIIDSSLFKWGTTRRKLEDLRFIISQKKPTGPGWDGNSVEKEYAAAILDIIDFKTQKLQKLGFDRFDKNWLDIYCNIMLPLLNLYEANELFVKNATNYWSKNGFSDVFVEKGDSIIWYSSEGTQILPLADLWGIG